MHPPRRDAGPTTGSPDQPDLRLVHHAPVRRVIQRPVVSTPDLSSKAPDTGGVQAQYPDIWVYGAAGEVYPAIGNALGRICGSST